MCKKQIVFFYCVKISNKNINAMVKTIYAEKYVMNITVIWKLNKSGGAADNKFK